MPDSWQRAQNGSKCGSPGERPSIGAGSHDDEARAAQQEPVELGERFAEIGEREERRAVDAAVGAVAPVLFEPAVEGAQARVERLAVRAASGAAARRRRPRSGA